LIDFNPYDKAQRFRICFGPIATFEQKHAARVGFGKSPGDSAAGRTTADDDVVKSLAGILAHGWHSDSAPGTYIESRVSRWLGLTGGWKANILTNTWSIGFAAIGPLIVALQ
jgi:hypothetical protein